MNNSRSLIENNTAYLKLFKNLSHYFLWSNITKHFNGPFQAKSINSIDKMFVPCFNTMFHLLKLGTNSQEIKKFLNSCLFSI